METKVGVGAVPRMQFDPAGDFRTIAGREVEILRLRPGDVLVLKYDGPLGEQARKNIREHLNAAGLQEYRMIVLDGGLELGVVRKE